MSPKISVGLDERHLDDLDVLVAEGRFASREDAIRAAVGSLVADVDRRRQIGDAIVEGYRRIPQSDDEDPWPDTQPDEGPNGAASR